MSNDTLKQILGKYRLQTPLSEEERRYISTTKNRVLKKILKPQKTTSLFRFWSLSLFCWLQKFPITLSLKAANSLVYGAATACLLLLVAGSVLLVNNYVLNKALIAAQDGILYQSKGSVTILRNNTALTLSQKTAIAAHDTIKTEKNADLTVQINNIGTVRFLQNTSASVAILDKALNSAEINLAHGTIFSNVLKQQRLAHYKITTPLCSATVVGTKFQVTYDGTHAEIKILEGSVKIKTNESHPKETLVTNGNSAVIDNQFRATVTPLTDVEKLQLQKTGLHEYEPSLEKNGSFSLEKHLREISIQEQSINAEIKQQKSKRSGQTLLVQQQLHLLQQQNKPVTVITSRNNVSITGYITRYDSSNVYVDSGDGIIKIELCDIIKLTPIN